MAKTTLEKYDEVKKKHPDAILLFRVGDFYELFHDDARTACRLIGLTLTTRNIKDGESIAMAGFPYHMLEGCLRKLIQAGYRASVLEQV